MNEKAKQGKRTQLFSFCFVILLVLIDFYLFGYIQQVALPS